MKPKTNDELVAEAHEHVEMAVSLLGVLVNKLEHVGVDMVRLRVTPPEDKCFEDCNKCVHGEDTMEVCILRKCVHAIGELTECYKPRGEEQHD